MALQFDLRTHAHPVISISHACLQPEENCKINQLCLLGKAPAIFGRGTDFCCRLGQTSGAVAVLWKGSLHTSTLTLVTALP